MNTKRTIAVTAFCAFMGILLSSKPAFAMHIMEGLLPSVWAALWFALSIPFLFWGVKSIKKITMDNPSLKMLLGLCAAFAFVLSSLKLPSITGSSSHPTGVGLGAILFGPAATSILALVVLVFQALLLAHGGISTLGANVFSMGIAGPLAAYYTYKGMSKINAPKGLCVFFAAALGNLLTYVVTSMQLGLAFPSTEGIMASVGKFMGIFAFTQIPLAISEGLLTVVVFNLLAAYNKEQLTELEKIGGNI